MASTFSFDIVSTFDKAEMNNVVMSAQREIANRYDFKNTPASIEWLGDKAGLKLTGNSDWQLESITDIIRKNLANRSLTSATLDLTGTPVTTNMKVTQEIPFVEGLDQDKAKSITKLLRDELPKVKATIQGDAVRVVSSSKDDLQKAMNAVNSHGFDFPVNFTNYR